MPGLVKKQNFAQEEIHSKNTMKNRVKVATICEYILPPKGKTVRPTVKKCPRLILVKKHSAVL